LPVHDPEAQKYYDLTLREDFYVHLNKLKTFYSKYEENIVQTLLKKKEEEDKVSAHKRFTSVKPLILYFKFIGITKTRPSSVQH